MAERGAKHTSVAVGVCPDAEVILFGVLAIRLAKPLGVGPDFLDLVQFALWGFPLGREGFHDGVLGREVFDRDSAVPLVAVGGNAEQFAPLVRLGVAVAVHRTVDDRRGDAGVAVCLGDILDPVDIGHAAETFVVNDDVVRLGPVLFFVDGNLDVTIGAALVLDVERDVGPGGNALGDDAGLVAVVVAAAAGDDQRAERFGGTDGKVAQDKGRQQDRGPNKRRFHPPDLPRNGLLHQVPTGRWGRRIFAGWPASAGTASCAKSRISSRLALFALSFCGAYGVTFK